MPAIPGPAAALGDVKHTVLLTTIHNLHDTPNFLASPVATAARTTTESLRIVILSPLFNPPPPAPDSPSPTATATATATAAPSQSGHPSHGHAPGHPSHEHERKREGNSSSSPAGVSRTACWDGVQRLLTFVYVQATQVAQDTGRVLLDIDVLLRGTAPEADAAEPLPPDAFRAAERVFSVIPHGTPLPPLPAALASRAADIIVLAPDDHPPHTHPPAYARPEDPDVPPLYPVVALGGTFDHLHAGHKILLSMGAWIAREKLIVGITDDALLGKKAYKDVLEPLPVRTARTRAFLALFRPAIAHDLVPIADVYGPTGWDPNVQALVVSKETLPGAASIDQRRAELGLPPLRTFVIDVISATEASVDAADAAVLRTAKMSSTYIREWIVKNRAGTRPGDGVAP